MPANFFKMEDEDNGSKWIIAFLVGALIWAVFFHKNKFEGQTAEEWFNAYDAETARTDDLENRISDLQGALEEANSEIEEAKSYSWQSYEEMGEALENLDSIHEP